MCLDKNMGEFFSFDLGKVFLGKTKKCITYERKKTDKSDFIQNFKRHY